MSSTSGNFFDLIHPQSGWRCLFSLPDRRHYWFKNSADLETAAHALDARGYAVFHSCATFIDKERKQEHVDRIRCLWLDIDAGIAKPYPDARTAYSALETWRTAVGLPPALIVASGGGIHAYWPLRYPLDRQRWAQLASGLRTLAVNNGLHIDTGSTIDAARILRPPGTHNRKIIDTTGKKTADAGGPARPVVCGPLIEPYDLAALSALGTASAHMTTNDPLAVVPAFLRGATDAVGITYIGHEDLPSDPTQIAVRCGQFSNLLASCAKGHDPLIGWYPFTGVLAFCGPAGEEYAKGLATDPGWIPVIEEKLARWQERASGPTTCARFAALDPGPCILCPHNGKITSPIQLGRELPVSATAPAPSRMELPALPKGFRWSGMRLVVERKPTDDDPSDCHVVSEYPVVVGELQETERSNKVSAVFRSWEPMRQDWRDFSLNMGEVVGQGGPAKVADHGVVVPKKRWENFVGYVNACANDHRGSRHYGIRYEQFGWKKTPDGPAFVLGDTMLRQGGTAQRIHGSDELDRRGKYMLPRGDAAAWTAAANKLVGRAGMEAHAFMMLCAFAAPLYHFTGELGATFVHGVTRGSGKGKTTMLEAGASVYGEREATSIIERDTLVSKFITLGTLCNLPIFFDEFRFPNPDDTKHYILQGTLGRDKQRAKVEGGLRSDQLHWSTIHISAANLSVTDTVRADGAEVAQAARIFEFTLALPDGTKTTEGDDLKKQLRANTGTAGPAFVQVALDHHAWVEKAIPARMKHYEQLMAAGPEERFILRLFACVDVAAALVRQAKLLDVDSGAIMSWAVGIQRGNANRLAVESLVDAGAIVSQMINDLVPHTIVMPRAQVQGKPSMALPPLREPRGELKARLEADGRKLLVDIVAVRRWMQEKNYPFTQIQKELLDLGVLQDARVRRTLAAGSGHSIGQTWCWQIDGQHTLLTDLIDTVAAPEGNVVPLNRGRA